MKIGQGGSTGGDKIGKMNNPNESGLGVLIDSHANVAEMASGEYTGTGVAFDVKLPFDPVLVIINNLTDGTTVAFVMATASVGTKSQKITGAGTAQDASNGVNIGATGTKKFTVGTGAAANTNAKVYQFIAFGF